MFHADDKNFENLQNKLSKKFDDKQNLANQTIHMRDIFVYPKEKEVSYGEATTNNKNEYQAYPVMVRLIDYIELLAAIANKYHQKYYCEEDKDGHFIIKPNCLNHITRILLNEFSLYAEKPLQEKDFSLLIEAVYTIAKSCQPNVHLLLSSIGVVTADQQILNMSLYVECGSDPKIASFCKASASSVDINYPAMHNFMQQQHIPYINESNPSAYVVSADGKGISCNTVFTVKTLGGAEYVQAIDICLDHKRKHAKKLVEKMIAADISHDTSLIPEQADHVLTSDSIDAIKFSQVTKYIVHIDPKNDFAQPMLNDSLTVDDFKHFKKNKYDKLLIEKPKEGVIVKDAPFGSYYKIVATQERRLDGLIQDLKDKVQERNKKVKQAIIESELKQIPYFKELFDNRDYISQQIIILYNDLLNKCKPGIMETFFNIKGYKQKLIAQDIINDSQAAFQKLPNDVVCLKQNIEDLLNKLKEQLQDTQHPISPMLVKDFVASIDLAYENMIACNNIEIVSGKRNERK